MTTLGSPEDKTTTEGVERQNTHDEITEGPKNLTVEAAAKGQGISGYETLTIWETVMHFKFSSFVCFIVTFSAATDGYQIGSVFRFDPAALND